VKRLHKIADQMQPELERDHPFARMIDAVPNGVCSFRCREPVGSESRHRSAQVAALAMSCAVDPIVRGNIEQTRPS